MALQLEAVSRLTTLLPASSLLKGSRQGTPLAPHSPGFLHLELYALTLQATPAPCPTHIPPPHPFLPQALCFHPQSPRQTELVPLWWFSGPPRALASSSSLVDPSGDSDLRSSVSQLPWTLRLKQPLPTLYSEQQLIPVLHSPPHCLCFGCFFCFLFMCGRLQCHIY